jgi:hypothetical protein
MDEDVREQREAERKAAALHTLGWEEGAGAAIWAQAIDDLLGLHESARSRFALNTADGETWARLHATAMMLVVAIDQVLAFETRVRRLTGDAELAKARERFDAIGPDSEKLRDLVAHLDEYAVGEGKRQVGALADLDEKNLRTRLRWGNGGETQFSLGDKRVDVQAAARAATELAEVVEQVRQRHLIRVSNEANAALRRRTGLPPE